MRNSGNNHYREMLFMYKLRMMDLLSSNLNLTSSYSERVFVYGNASKKIREMERNIKAEMRKSYTSLIIIH